MDYVTWANIQRLQRIASDLDPEKRRILEGLLAEQVAKLKGDARAAQDGVR